ncbi:LD-carboxypeptidase [Streptomyces sp. TRM43335]|uniref:LD-carboxypeptidase n=1 Tax=Streptomyces taklimakanensis TaxID=2569853 RepID=A0A6G2BH68_9ACTN|nr:LD-carboxypeptidase [Streptomyces taklimakanensis]MTE21608.1 LD-carboxypeptidase [Streptomyces taklimakanensis]
MTGAPAAPPPPPEAVDRPRARPPVRPRRLRPGDRVAIVAPSGPVLRERLDAGLDVLRGWDLDPQVMPHVLDVHPELDHLAGTDADRARDLTDAWCDPSVAAVLAARGGYGAQRMVELVDWEAMRAAGPKVFVGYSDITALHEAVAARLGLVTLHGPMPATASFLKDADTQDHLRRTLLAPETVTEIAPPAARTLVPGRAHGTTFGGCLSLLAGELGVRGRRPARPAGGILLLEDVGEKPYRLDGHLTHLLRSGALDDVTGVVLGSWHDCGPYEEVRAVLLDRLVPLGVPVVEEMGFGHGPTTRTLPLGVPATLDADACVLTLEEPALT